MRKFFLTILKNIFQRELVMWYHSNQNNSFLVGIVVSGQFDYTTSGEELFYFVTKKYPVFMWDLAFRKRLKK